MILSAAVKKFICVSTYKYFYKYFHISKVMTLSFWIGSSLMWKSATELKELSKFIVELQEDHLLGEEEGQWTSGIQWFCGPGASWEKDTTHHHYSKVAKQIVMRAPILYPSLDLGPWICYFAVPSQYGQHDLPCPLTLRSRNLTHGTCFGPKDISSQRKQKRLDMGWHIGAYLLSWTSNITMKARPG